MQAARRVYTQGCVPTIKVWVENNLYLVGGVAVGVAISLVCLEQIV